jgi:hypothetical protein
VRVDVTALFDAIKNGGPPVVFVLVSLLGLLLSGHLRTGKNYDEKDAECKRLTALLEKAQEQQTQQQALFREQMSLVRDEILPMLRDRRYDGRGR